MNNAPSHPSGVNFTPSISIAHLDQGDNTTLPTSTIIPRLVPNVYNNGDAQSMPFPDNGKVPYYSRKYYTTYYIPDPVPPGYFTIASVKLLTVEERQDLTNGNAFNGDNKFIPFSFIEGYVSYMSTKSSTPQSALSSFNIKINPLEIGTQQFYSITYSPDSILVTPGANNITLNGNFEQFFQIVTTSDNLQINIQQISLQGLGGMICKTYMNMI